MRCLKIFVFIFAVLFFISDSELSNAQDEEYPKIGFAKKDGSNVRAGDNVNYEILCKLKPGDPVKVIGKRYSWYKIELPPKTHIYINSDFVDYDNQSNIGIVSGENVNLRAGPGTKYTILGQLSSLEKVDIISEKDGWYEISPPSNVSGWMHSSQVVFNIDGIEQVEPEKNIEKDVAATANEEPQQKFKGEAKNKKSSVTLSIKDSSPKGNLSISTSIK